jgi:hypothetical protein
LVRQKLDGLKGQPTSWPFSIIFSRLENKHKPLPSLSLLNPFLFPKTPSLKRSPFASGCADFPARIGQNHLKLVWTRIHPETLRSMLTAD